MTSNTTKIAIGFVITIVISTLVWAAYANAQMAKQIEAYDAYNRDVEILLDSIASYNNSFMDTIGESDTYCNYVDSRENLDKLIH